MVIKLHLNKQQNKKLKLGQRSGNLAVNKIVPHPIINRLGNVLFKCVCTVPLLQTEQPYCWNLFHRICLLLVLNFCCNKSKYFCSVENRTGVSMVRLPVMNFQPLHLHTLNGQPVDQIYRVLIFSFDVHLEKL